MDRKRESRTGRFRVGVTIVVGLCCIFVPRIAAQNNANSATPVNPAPVLTAQIPFSPEILMEHGILPKALKFYRRAAHELHQGDAISAEKDANYAVALDANFADAKALAATAALTQRQFLRASAEAHEAVHLNANDEKAWVVLATADNYLGRYGEAMDALSNVREQDRMTWQVAYQWARAEAGRNHAAEALEWSNRAALAAPYAFAPLHLLRAGALLAANQYSQSANELEVYLQLLGKAAPNYEELTRELQRIRALAQKQYPRPAAATAAGFNTPAN